MYLVEDRQSPPLLLQGLNKEHRKQINTSKQAVDHPRVMNADKQKQAQQQQQQQQHGATNDNIYNNKLKSRWSNWVEEQNRKNGIRASKPANIVVLKFAGRVASPIHTGHHTSS